jgi:hypothetical protein
MTAYDEAYEAEESESFEDFEMADEVRRGRKVSIRGTGVTKATLNTPKGSALLSLPAAVTTLTQFKQLQSAHNAQTQRMNALHAELVRLRRELAARGTDQSGMGLLFPLILQKKLRDDLEGHTHSVSGAATGAPIFPAGSGGGFSSLLPILLLAPNMFGGGTSTAGAPAMKQQQDTISPLLLLLLLGDL